MKVRTFQIGEFVQLKKNHPSKTINWEIVSIGASVKLRSTIKTDLIIEIKRQKFLKVIK